MKIIIGFVLNVNKYKKQRKELNYKNYQIY